MISYWENFGEDIDSNRGKKVLIYELTNDDTPAIRNELYRLLRQDEYKYSDTVWIQLLDPATGDMIDFEVEISEYISREQFERIIHE